MHNFSGTQCTLSPDYTGKNVRYHRSMKNVITLDHYYFPGELMREIAGSVDNYTNHRYHKSLNTLTSVDMYEGRDIKKITKSGCLPDEIPHINFLLNLSYTL